MKTVLRVLATVLMLGCLIPAAALAAAPGFIAKVERAVVVGAADELQALRSGAASYSP